MRAKIRLVLLALLIGSTALFPPETGAIGWLVAVTLAAMLAFTLVFSPTPSSGAGTFPSLLGLAAIYLTTLILASSQSNRSLSLMVGASLGLVAFMAAKLEEGRPMCLHLVARSVVGVASVASLHALYQRAFGLAEMARELRAIGDPALDSLVIRAESGRAFGPFPLPAALGVYLSMALPLAVWGWSRARAAGRRGSVWVCLGLLQLAGIAASLSFGALLSLVSSCLLWLLVTRPRKRILGVATLAVTGGILFALFAFVRHGEGWSPLILRARNWVVAGKVFLENPWLGVGPGNFVDAYPRYLRVGMNETAYAHNSYLQVAAEGGILALVWVVLAVGMFFRRSYRTILSSPNRWETQLLIIPPTLFLIHNLIDFSAYLPSLTTTFGGLMGLAWPSRACPTTSRESSSPAWALSSRSRGAISLALILLCLGGAAWGYREGRTRLQMIQARDELSQGDLEKALGTLNRAARGNPTHPDPPALMAEVYLSRIRDYPGESEAGERWARRAVELRPRRAYGHYLLSQYRIQAGDLGEAWVRLGQARRLFPEKTLYREEASRLQGLIKRATDTNVETVDDEQHRK